MSEMTDDQVNRVLAKLVGKDSHFFKPTLGRDNLAEVLAKLTPEQWDDLTPRLHDTWKNLGEPTGRFIWWTHTCDPAIIARAVAEVVGK